MTEPDEASRRAARSTRPVRRHRLGEDPPDDLLSRTTAEERLAMMWPLTLEAAGTMRGLKPRQRATVKRIRAEKGIHAAIRAAVRLAG